MQLLVKGVLAAEELATIEGELAGARFSDGSVSAHGDARRHKHVLQLDRSGDGQQRIGEIVVRALLRHPLVQAAALPKAVRHPTINRYEPGMHYGPHVDAPIMGGKVPTRADLSVTVFLNDPASYEGGELRLHEHDGVRALTGRAGDAVIYSTDSVHEVTPVTSGVRLVAVTWIQSAVRGHEERRILFDLRSALESLERRNAEPAALLGLRQSYNNLVRLWAEP